MSKVYFHGSRAMARQLARRVVDALTGKNDDGYRIARGVFLSIGFAALSSIKADFLVKSRGGTGEDGNKWAPLSKEYLAYGREPGEKRGSGRRFGPGEKTALKTAAGIGRAERFGVSGNRGLLTKDQQRRWNAIFATRLARLSLSMPLVEAKAIAGRIAWATIKREGGRTMLEVFGNRQVDILRDTGVLFNSLSPGQLDSPGPNASYQPPSGQGGDEQIFETISNGVIVGTNVPYGIYHQQGQGNRFRPFLPTGDIPERWEQEWLDVGVLALEIGVRQMYEAA